MQKKQSIDVVIPVYGCPEALEELMERLTKVLGEVSHQHKIILVDDRCPMNSWQYIVELRQRFDNMVGIRFSRNFGQHNAISAGLAHAKADWVVVMDCDLQDKPEEIVNLVKGTEQGAELVFAKRVSRKDSTFKKLGSKLFHQFLSYMTETKSDASIANFSIISRKVVDAFLLYPESTRAYPILVRSLGFIINDVPVESSERHSGTSSYTLKKLLKLAAEVSISFSDKPMWLMIYAGFWVAAGTFIAGIYKFVDWIINGSEVAGWTSLILSIWFLGGVIISMLGLVGVYIAKTFDESKQRPIYIVDEII